MKQVESPRRASQRQVFARAGPARWSGSCSSHKPTRNRAAAIWQVYTIFAETQKLRRNFYPEKVLPAWLQLLGIVYLSVLEGSSISHTDSLGPTIRNSKRTSPSKTWKCVKVIRDWSKSRSKCLFYKACTLKPDSAHLSNRQNARACLILSEVLGSLAGSIWEHLKHIDSGNPLIYNILQSSSFWLRVPVIILDISALAQVLLLWCAWLLLLAAFCFRCFLSRSFVLLPSPLTMCGLFKLSSMHWCKPHHARSHCLQQDSRSAH